MKYGSYFNLTKYGLTVIVNGFWFAIFKNLNTGKWDYKITKNLWRKTLTPKPYYE